MSYLINCDQTSGRVGELKGCTVQSFSIHIMNINIHLDLLFYNLDYIWKLKYAKYMLKILCEEKYLSNYMSFHEGCIVPNSIKKKSMHALIDSKFHIQHRHTKLQNWCTKKSHKFYFIRDFLSFYTLRVASLIQEIRNNFKEIQICFDIWIIHLRFFNFKFFTMSNFQQFCL